MFTQKDFHAFDLEHVRFLLQWADFGCPGNRTPGMYMFPVLTWRLCYILSNHLSNHLSNRLS